MKSIMEIPVFADQAYFNKLLNSTNASIERKYQDFSLFEHDLDADHAIFFYLIARIPDSGLDILIDQVIPKTPFSLMILSSADSLEQQEVQATFNSYHKRYSTPLHLCAAKENSEGLEEFLSTLDPDKYGSKLLLFDQENSKALNEVVAEVIKYITAKN